MTMILKAGTLKTTLSFVVLAVALSACGSSGPTYREQRVAAALDNRGQYLEDQGITSKVAAVFTAEPRFRDAQIRVTTVDNVVTLSGFVHSGSDIGAAEEMAMSVEGVADVRNALRVN